MRGSGIYSQDVSYDEFECENEDCGQTNPEGDTTTDDWGNYTIICEFCGSEYREGNLDEDRASEKEDADYGAWRDSQLDWD